MNINTLLWGLINPIYYPLIVPISLLIIGFVIKKRAEGKVYVGRLTMFSNSMALFSFYAFIPNVPLWMIWIVNISIILGIVGIVSYAKIDHKLKGWYYDFTKYFDSIYVGFLILIYYFIPNLFH